MTNPLLSICIPVYKSEASLRRCLESVAGQDFEGAQIVLVNDGSPLPADKKQSCKNIVKQFRKEHKLSKNQLLYREHRSNLGLLEARRSLVEAASGHYILMVDSDDALAPGALKVLYQAALESGADIVQGKTKVVCLGAEGQPLQEEVLLRQKSMQQVANKIFCGMLTENQIFDGYILQKNHNGFLWGKLYRRELYLEALAHIPFTRCVYSEDFLQYFFISYLAKKYVGIDFPVYEYSVDTGISSFTKITDLKRWEQVCTAANVFTILFTAAKELPSQRFTPEHQKALALKSRFVLSNTLEQMRQQVAPSILPEARALMCQYWGEDFVKFEEARALSLLKG